VGNSFLERKRTGEKEGDVSNIISTKLITGQLTPWIGPMGSALRGREGIIVWKAGKTAHVLGEGGSDDSWGKTPGGHCSLVTDLYLGGGGGISQEYLTNKQQRRGNISFQGKGKRREFPSKQTPAF